MSVSLNNQHIYLIIDAVDASIYWKDTDGYYLGCNNYMLKMAGIQERSDIIGKKDSQLFWHDISEDLEKIDQSVLLTGRYEGEETPITANNDRRTFHTTKTILFDENRNVIGIIGVSVDITELKRSKEAAEAASRAKTEFIANMGHDIRTPLTGIIGMSSILEEELQQQADEKEHATIIHQSGEQLLGLLNGVLDLITVDSSNEDSVHQEPFDVRRVIHDVIELERPAVEARQLKIESHIDEAIPAFVVNDKMKLHRILLNLAGNAIKFTKVGHIEINAKLVSIKDDEAKILFSVEDTGIGIPDELQSKVFDRFFKVSPSYKGLYTGNGIGLHIVQKYLELLGGDIRLSSSVGVGTTFSFVLSMKIGQKPKEEMHEDEDFKPEPTRPMRAVIQAPAVAPVKESMNPNQVQVLLVEDNAAALKVLAFMVQRFNVQVSQAIDAESALDLVKSQHFDLVITDLGLPGLSGDEMTTAIRAYERDNHLNPMKIVGLTGHALDEAKQACLDAGMNDVHQKPIPPDTLKTLINEFLI